MGQRIVYIPGTNHQHVVSESQAANMVRYGEWEYKPAPKKPKTSAKPKAEEPKEPTSSAGAEPKTEGVEVFEADDKPITAERDYHAMSYADLKSLAAKRDLGGTGTTDELIAKHLAYHMDAE